MKELFNNSLKVLDQLYDNVRSADVIVAEGFLLSASELIKLAQKKYFNKYKDKE